MILNAYRLLLCLLALSVAMAHPIQDRAELNPRSPFNAVPDPSKSHPLRKACKKVTDCSCPNNPNSKTGHSTSCINGFCSCDNAVVNALSNAFMSSVIAIGNAPITKAIGHLMQGLADAKQVLSTIVAAMLPPPLKAALKTALNAFPDTGPSHIDKATKGILTKVL
ncbi:hypothetical protein FPV67DRAFT_721310 [Lyophyllum atratum]|nr:hypothetical protein FPV67DRAFT_721310 [Lyophyllum atratum]